jgi:small multidrug resistance pump
LQDDARLTCTQGRHCASPVALVRHRNHHCATIESAPMPAHYIYLFFAILTETIGTTALQASAQFTRLWPSIIVVIGYGASFWLMALALKTMQVGIVYAIWSGLGIVFIAAIGFFVFGQRLDVPALIGMALILIGILVIHLFSSTATH